jgi:hypothetical protein
MRGITFNQRRQNQIMAEPTTTGAGILGKIALLIAPGIAGAIGAVFAMIVRQPKDRTETFLQLVVGFIGAGGFAPLLLMALGHAYAGFDISKASWVVQFQVTSATAVIMGFMSWSIAALALSVRDRLLKSKESIADAAVSRVENYGRRKEDATP